ncbi:Isochorismatase [Candidatus Francisella endociliophora]|uniref:Isochorismatase n=1 Tax=Candidatus Francisella endociliophora TaxID=653937 RepID=A0A097EP41_9GAMM|nr:isochorismatase family cysteine hydrolase [Francisella sp. FSC1006]AIT09336.1 Isochorismatase [Francisella sp. FSC1006]
MAKNALIIIDVQNFFITEDMHQLPRQIKELIISKNFDHVIFCKFVNDPQSNFYKILDWKYCEESPDIDIHPEMLEFVNENNVFEKSTFSAFKSELPVFLNKENINKLYLCGVDTDACILASAFDAFDLGYDVEILIDYCQSSNGDKANLEAFKIIRRNFVRAQNESFS